MGFPTCPVQENSSKYNADAKCVCVNIYFNQISGFKILLIPCNGSNSLVIESK